MSCSERVLYLNTKTRELTEGATVVGILGAFLVLDRQFAGLLNEYLFWAIPFPFVVFAAKYGWKSSVIPLICSILISFVLGIPLMGFMILMSGLTGIVYGNGVKYGWGNMKVAGCMLFFNLVKYFVSMVLLAKLFGYDLTAEIKVIFEQLQTSGFQLTGISMEAFIRNLIPISIGLTSVLETIIVLFIGNFLLKRLGIKTLPLKLVSQIKAPKWLGWILLAVMVFSATNTRFKWIEDTQGLIFILNFFAEMVFVFFGYIHLLYTAAATNRRFMKWFAVIALIMFPGILVIVGIFDTVTDYRERILGRVQK